MISIPFDPFSVEKDESPFFYHSVQYDKDSGKALKECKRKLCILLYCEFPDEILQKGFDHIHLRVDRLSEVDYPWSDIVEMYSYVRTHCSKIRIPEHPLQMFCLKYWDYFSPTIRKQLSLKYPIGVSIKPTVYGKVAFY